MAFARRRRNNTYCSLDIFYSGGSTPLSLERVRATIELRRRLLLVRLRVGAVRKQRDGYYEPAKLVKFTLGPAIVK